ncbi:hypothetical protein MSUIS_01060 [Mycoplasma suis KI3806]|uniref:Uncharacterized protein n=1 Tax=Mycoplasma suis (strain KI_3806) TaxID=708248 RepID=F0V2X7_MYCS3|nr:hypothetical protein [Mycoplasma suis]CBZ40199.1 hypothetical protein MSUIS_01060 [Mycoplasma suis KI3806]
MLGISFWTKLGLSALTISGVASGTYFFSNEFFGNKFPKNELSKPNHNEGNDESLRGNGNVTPKIDVSEIKEQNPEVTVITGSRESSISLDPSLTADYLITTLVQEKEIKSCSTIKEGKVSENVNCENITSKHWNEQEKQKNPRVWVKAQNEENVSKVLKVFFISSGWEEGNLNKESWEQKSYDHKNLICSKRKDSEQHIIVSCSEKN